MNLDIITIILGIIGCIVCVLAWVYFIVKHRSNVTSIVVSFILFVGLIILMIWGVIAIRESITSDYRCVDSTGSYKIFDITYEGKSTVIHYLNENKELNHIKMEKTKVYYDLSDDKEPYAVKKTYWRWFIYWDEIEVHIKE